MSVEVFEPGPLTVPHTTVEQIFAAMRTGFPGQADLDPTGFPIYGLLTSNLTLVPTVGDPGWVLSSWTTSEGAHYLTYEYGGDKPAGTYHLWGKLVVGGGHLPIRGPKVVVLA